MNAMFIAVTQSVGISKKQSSRPYTPRNYMVPSFNYSHEPVNVGVFGGNTAIRISSKKSVALWRARTL